MSPVRSLVVLLALPLFAAADDPKPPVKSPHFARMEFEPAEGDALVYYLMKPASVREGERYPLVLALHGRGGNTQAAAVLASDEMRKQYPCFVIAPVASRRHRWAVPESFTRLPGNDLLPAVLEAVDAALEKHPIDPDRVYVTGQSMGGFGTFGALAARPKLFAAAVPICGGWDPADAKRFADVPLWAFHGSKDSTVKPELSEKMIEALKAAGGEPKFTLYEGVGHNSWSRAYESLETWKWMFAQRRPAAKLDSENATEAESTPSEDQP